MGGCSFSTMSVGKTAKEAFRDAVDEAQWENGHGGYTGTIAEKHYFTEILVPEKIDPLRFLGAWKVWAYSQHGENPTLTYYTKTGKPRKKKYEVGMYWSYVDEEVAEDFRAAAT